MRSIPFRGFLVAALAATALTSAAALPCRADLDEYVKQPDPVYAWQKVASRQTPLGKVEELELTSQVWQGITWKHALQVYEAVDKPGHDDAVLLFITGGSTGKKPGPDMDPLCLTLSKLAGARVALLSQVPNQPLLDGKKEDDLIAETFVRYLETKDETWPLLFPMTKSAVRAMDAVQEWAKQERKVDVSKFVVTGASKRGWTTWLTSEVDDRVVALVPMVIVMLNLGDQGPNQLDVWGAYSEQIDDYVRRGLMEEMQKPGPGTKLWKMVDPFTLRDRLANKPKFLINGANDQYWTQNALDLFWDELPGDKHVMFLPNAGHGLDGDRSWVVNGIAAFFRSGVEGKPFPKLDWKLESASKGQYALRISADPAPKSARLWTAESPTRDFRDSKWVDSPLEPGAIVTGLVTAPETGGKAVYADLEYEYDGLPYHLTTSFFEPGLELRLKKEKRATKAAAAPAAVGAAATP